MDKKQFLQLFEQAKEGDKLALGKALTFIENNREQSWEYLKELNYPDNCKIIGITGAPGAGKSSLIDKIVAFYSDNNNRKVAVIAVDPSSPFTGGAILGDRLRMNKHSLKDNIFIRSVASRGNLGGIASCVYDMAEFLKAVGFERIVIETVGVGQSEIDIVEIADIVLLVLTPAAGDDIQALKAGVMEIADIFVVNKSDIPGADRVKRALESVFIIEGINKPIVLTSANANQGIEELVNTIESETSIIDKNKKIFMRILHSLKEIVEDRIIEFISNKVKNVKISEPAQLYKLLDDLKNSINFSLNKEGEGDLL